MYLSDMAFNFRKHFSFEYFFQDLQKILDNAKHGAVYMNFGSNVRSSELPPEKRDAIINVFRKLKQTVLWKWEDDKLENKPSNLIVRNWMPQKEILCKYYFQIGD